METTTNAQTSLFGDLNLHLERKALYPSLSLRARVILILSARYTRFIRRGEQEGITQAAFSSAFPIRLRLSPSLSLFLFLVYQSLSLPVVSPRSRCIINGKRGASIYARPLLLAFHARLWNYIDPRESLSSSCCLPCPPSLFIVPVQPIHIR